MKKRGFVFVAAMVMMLGLAACKAEETKEEDTSAAVEQAEDEPEDAYGVQSEGEAEPEPGDEAEASDGEAAERDSSLDNFDADMGEVFDFAALVKEAVAEKDLEKLSKLTGFPVYVGLDGVDVVETKEEFLALDPDEVFSEEMMRSIEKADIQDLAASMAGFTLMDYDTQGSAGITFGAVNGEILITGINYGY